MSSEIKQCWAANGQDFNFESLLDLLESHPDLIAGDVVQVGQACHPDSSQLVDADDVMEQMTDRAWDIAGEYAMGYPDVSKEAKDELDALLRAWIEKHCPPDFYTVKDSTEYTLTESDVEAE